jgi:aspartyl/asparaginyl beta-hydroxylase (cupin superfamily)
LFVGFPVPTTWQQYKTLKTNLQAKKKEALNLVDEGLLRGTQQGDRADEGVSA